MKQTLKVLAIVALGFLAVFLVLCIYFAPVIDRTLRPCAYYPNVFIDCREEQ